MRWRFIRIGMYNVDSYWGGCTTHFGYLVVKKLYEVGGYLVDYPKLIRLNPDIPWKTRGNGCVCLDAMMPKNKMLEFIDWLENTLFAYMDEIDGYSIKNQPAVIIIDGELICNNDIKLLNDFYVETLHSVVYVDRALKIIESIKEKIIFIHYPYGPRGLIGALSALGNMLVEDYTYELLIYRELNKRSKDRFRVPEDLIRNVLIEDEDTFAHIDPENNKILITPAGPDPVVVGIRGDKISSIFSVFNKIKKFLDYSGWMLFVTNQGTNANLLVSREDNEYYNQVVLELTLFTKLYLKGGHLMVIGEGEGGRTIINFYYESGRVRRVLDELLDKSKLDIIVGGGIKPNKMDDVIDRVINPQIVIIPNTIIDYVELVNPVCPRCKVNLKSGGEGQSYKCKKCGYRIVDIKPRIHKKVSAPNILLPPYRSILHISKPLKRMGREKRHRLYGIKKMRWIH